MMRMGSFCACACLCDVSGHPHVLLCMHQLSARVICVTTPRYFSQHRKRHSDCVVCTCGFMLAE